MKTQTVKTAAKSFAPLTRAAISKMNAHQLLIELHRRGVNIEDAKSVLRGKSTCPNCGHEGPIERDFGVRVMRGALWPQSWCRKCRGQTH